MAKEKKHFPMVINMLDNMSRVSQMELVNTFGLTTVNMRVSLAREQETDMESGWKWMVQYI